MKFHRMTVRHDQRGGVACIRELRSPAATIVGLEVMGMNDREILAGYPDLQDDDIRGVRSSRVICVGWYKP